MQEQTKVGQYVLERKLGEGGMAEVWEARHIHLGSRAAIKFLLPRVAGNRELEDRFLNEGKRQARLQHPNIVAATDFLQVDGRSYLVMQYVEGENLDTKLRQQKGSLARRDVQEISSDVLSALDYAHSLGVVHRDVKPSNILLDKNGRAMLSDFGIALALGEDHRMTRTGMAVGTPDYMSPEQIVRPKAVDARSDIYSFGCVLYAMLTGRPPFGGDGATEFYIQDCHVRTPPPPLAHHNPSISPALERVVLQCLEKDPAKRFQSCGLVLSALNAIPSPGASKVSERKVGQYVLEEKLGEGGMAEVWRARHQVLGTRVAVKFLSASVAGIPDIEQRFLGEGKRQAHLQHPNIVSAFDFLYIDERSYLIMRFIEGQSLDEWLFKVQAPLSIPQALAISADVLHALGYAHLQNVIHRDIKPSNILIENSGRAFVMDFGIALALGEQRATQVGSAIGTPQFMSPEQIVGAPNIDGRSDIYSFGCVLYQILTRRLPFDAEEGAGDTEYAIKDKHLRQKPMPPRLLNPNIPEHIERAILRCLEKNAADRFATCEEALLALTQTPVRRTPTSVEVPTRRPTDSPPPVRTPLTPKTVLLPAVQPVQSVLPIQPASRVAPVQSVQPPPPVAVLASAAVVASPTVAPSQSSGRGTLPWIVSAGLLTLALLGGGFYMYTRRQQELPPPPVAVPQPSAKPTSEPPLSQQPGEPVAAVKPDDQPEPQVNSLAPEPNPVVKKKPVRNQATPAHVMAYEKPATKPPVVPPPVEVKDLSGNWQGQYNHPGTNELKKLSLQIAEDRSDLLTGTLAFDAGGTNASSCSVSGNYNPSTRFMLLIVSNCHGRVPNYLQGKIGFAGVNSSDHQVQGVDQMHDGLVNMSRQ
jgi:serine/threonine protein kinase